MRLAFRFTLCIGLCALLFFGARPAWSQTGGTGALTVSSTDPSGAVIAGATITLSNASGFSRTAPTGQDGSYTFTLLPPGAYRVDISAHGFKEVNIPSVTVDVSETHVLNQRLEIGATTQEVTVNSDVEMVQTETSTLGGVVGTNQIISLPLITRNFTQITSLSPGVVTDVYNAATLGRGGLDFSVNGQNQSSNNISVDGVSVNNLSTGQNTNPEGFYGDILYPSPDAIQEFKVQTGLYDAGYGRQSGANVNVVTKSGTDSVHGSAFEFLRNNDLDANGYFQNEVGLPRGDLKQNQFGGSVGGPIVKDKLFYFFSYQGTRQVNGISTQGFQTISLPVQLTNTRTAAALGSEFCPSNYTGGTPGYVYTQTALANAPNPNPASDFVKCDGSNINPVALNILNAKTPSGQLIIPSPQIIANPGKANAVGEDSLSVPAIFNDSLASASIDWNLSAKNTLSVKYFFDFGTQIRGFNCSPCTLGSGSHHLSGDNLDIVKWTSLVTNSFVNEVRFSKYYIRASDDTTDPLTHAGIGMQNFAINDWIDLGPILTFSGLFTQGGSAVDESRSPQNDYEFSDQVSWNKGRHTLRFGFDLIYYQWNLVYSGQDRGSLSFSSFADFLLGESASQNGSIVSNIASAAGGIIVPVGGVQDYTRELNPSLFVQDDVKVNQRLTLNLGLRWEYFGSTWDAKGNNVDDWYFLAQTVPIPPASGTLAGYTVANNYTGTVPAGVVRRSTQVQTQGGAPLHDFAPRIGFAWQPLGTSGKLVLRGGSGFFFTQFEANNMLNTNLGSPPLVAPIGFSGTVNAPATLQTPWFLVPVLGFSSFVRTPTSAPITTGNEIDPFLVPGHTITTDLNLQYNFAPSWVLELGYVNARGEHLWGVHPLNEAVLATPTTPVNCGLPTGCVYTNSTANAQQRVPVIGYSSGGFKDNCSCGDSTYNSLQVNVRKTFSRGSTFQAAYTYGKALDDLVGLERGGSLNSNDPNNLRQMKGNSDFNRPQRLSVNYTYQVPDFHKSQGFAGRALSGWSASGVTTVQTGEPLTLTDPLGGGVYAGAGASRAQLCPGGSIGSLVNSGRLEGKLNNYFNGALLADTPLTPSGCALPIVGAFASPGTGIPASPGATGYGNLSRGILLGPGQNNWDISLAKKTRVGGIHEDADLEFRAEFFNAFNKSQFSNPGVAVSRSGGSFGVITSTTVAARIIQLALRYDF